MNVSYMNVFAVIRLLLLLFPLAYHSYTGTAVKFPAFYHFFYAVSTMVLLGHMLAIIMLDPDSLTSLVPSGNRLLSKVTRAQEHAMSMRHVWLELSLSLFSTAMHVVLFYHVRSSAPSPYLNEDGDENESCTTMRNNSGKGRILVGTTRTNMRCC